jgi:hypothetical protein
VGRIVTFSFSSTNYEGTEATETFTLEELNLDDEMEEGVLMERINKTFEAWVWEKLNISSSIVIGDDDQWK